MTSRVFVVLVILATLGRTSEAQVACADPMPADSGWWHWTTVKGANGANEQVAPDGPEQPHSFRVSQLAGKYMLRMTTTVGRGRGDQVLADVVIRPDSTGTATVRGGWPDYFSLKPDSGGGSSVRISFPDAGPRRLVLILGTSDAAEDFGVLLHVFATDRATIVGRWVDGGGGVDSRSHLHPQGWFCLQRQGP